MVKQNKNKTKAKYIDWDVNQCSEIQRWADSQDISFTEAVYRLCEFALSSQYDKEYARYLNASISEMRGAFDIQFAQIITALEVLDQGVEVLTHALLEEEDGEY